MNDEKRETAAREAALVANRIEELYEKPVRGKFDLQHLKAVHAHIFQDLPQHRPGVTRGDTGDWIKHRVPEGYGGGYDVHYEAKDVAGKMADILDQFGGQEAIEDLEADEAAERLAELYGDLDHAHGFLEGNSRRLREFTRELANEAGFVLDWAQTGTGAKERNALYLARDLAVLERAFPALTPERAMQTKDRTEYEASFVIEGLRRVVADMSLATIIRSRLRRQ